MLYRQVDDGVRILNKSQVVDEKTYKTWRFRKKQAHELRNNISAYLCSKCQFSPNSESRIPNCLNFNLWDKAVCCALNSSSVTCSLLGEVLIRPLSNPKFFFRRFCGRSFYNLNHKKFSISNSFEAVYQYTTIVFSFRRCTFSSIETRDLFA